MNVWITGIATVSKERTLESRQARRMARVSRFAMAAAGEALRDADRKPDPDMGVVCASTHLSTQYALEFHEGFLNEGKPTPGPILFSNGCLNAAGSHISLEYRLTGCNRNLVGGMNVGIHALGVAARLLEDGPCAAILCVACEEISEILAGAYRKFRLAPPMTLGEGAAAVLLEKENRGRGVRIGAFHTAHGPDIRHDVEGRTIAQALEAVGPADLYSACANGTELDEMEKRAVETVLPGVPTLRVKDSLGEGFAFTSLAQVTGAIARNPGTVVACSYDRAGDVSAVRLG